MSLLRTRIRMLSVAGVVLVSAVVASVGSASAQAAQSGDLDGTDYCKTPATLVSVASIRADGTPALPGTPSGMSATKYTYSLEGDLLTEVEPPAGWKPVSGTDQELRTYGFPPRPTDPAGRGQWNQEFSSWKYNVTSGMCETDKYS
jgi:hypothetical protein